MYEERFYRDWMECDDLERFQVVMDKSDLFVLCQRRGLSDLARAALKEVRGDIERYIGRDGVFKDSLEPISVVPDAPAVVKTMARAARAWDVGPMAAVAGVIAEFVGSALAEDGGDVIVENGGDIWAKVNRKLTFALYAGEESPFRDKIAFTLDARDGVGVCTSSGKVGPSLSYGNADAVVAIAEDTAFADAAATSIANCIKRKEDINTIIEEQKVRGDLKGIIACLGDRLGMWGDIEIANK